MILRAQFMTKLNFIFVSISSFFFYVDVFNTFFYLKAF